MLEHIEKQLINICGRINVWKRSFTQMHGPHKAAVTFSHTTRLLLVTHAPKIALKDFFLVPTLEKVLWVCLQSEGIKNCVKTTAEYCTKQFFKLIIRIWV